MASILRRFKSAGSKNEGQEYTEVVEPLDSQEQDKVVDEIKRQADRLERNWRLAFCVGFSAIALIFLCCCLYGAVEPWRFHHQYFFAEHLHFAVFQVYYFLSAVVFIFAARIIKVSRQRVSGTEIVIPAIISGMVALFWLVLFVLHSVTTPALYWLPVADAAGLGFALYLDADMTGTLSDVDRLEGLKYEFHKI